MSLTAVEQEVWDALQAHAFNGPVCRPSQQLLADTLGRCREHINRVLHRLRDKGYLTWTREKRPGSRWEHNVYTLAFWVPPLRKRTVAKLKRLRASKSASHTEGTPKASNPLSPSSSMQGVNKRLGLRASNEAKKPSWRERYEAWVASECRGLVQAMGESKP